MDVFYYSELCNMTQCETVTLEMRSQICIAFLFKILYPLTFTTLGIGS